MAEGASIKALIVDDSKIIRMTIKKFLKDRAEVVAEANDGTAAVEAYQELQGKGELPDVVLMDINMDLMDGLEASKEILKMNPNAAIIIVSAQSGQDMIKQAIDIGVKEYVVKPFTEEQLLDAVNSVVGAV